MAPRDAYWVCAACGQWSYAARAECWGCRAARPGPERGSSSAPMRDRVGGRWRHRSHRQRDRSESRAAPAAAREPSQGRERDEVGEASKALRALEALPEVALRAIPGYNQLLSEDSERKASLLAARRAQLPAHERLRKVVEERARRQDAVEAAEEELREALAVAERRRHVLEEAKRGLADAERAVVQVQAELGQSAVSANTPLVQRLRAAAAEPSTANMPALL